MVRNLGEFAFFDHSYLDDKVIYKDLGFILRKDNIARALSFIADLLKEHSPQLLVIDSFKAIRDMCDDEKEFRTFVFELGAMLSIWEVTTFFIGEYSIEEVNTLCEFAIADGIFHLYGTEDTRFQKRFLSILKCRGTEYLPGEHMFEISSEGIRLYPRLKPDVSNVVYATGKERKTFGIEKLDQILGGGLPEGSITILTGSSGTGKTIFSLKFLIEGALKGEKSLYLSFEEPGNKLIDYGRKFGWRVDEAIENGLFNIEFISPMELDVDIHGAIMLTKIREQGIKRLVIDSITSFERSAKDLQKYKDYLWALSQELKIKGVTAIYLLLNHELFSPLVVSQVPLSSLADNIIFLRYAEEDNRLKRLLGVLKVRGSDHDKKLWEYEIDSTGIQLKSHLSNVQYLR